MAPADTVPSAHHSDDPSHYSVQVPCELCPSSMDVETHPRLGGTGGLTALSPGVRRVQGPHGARVFWARCATVLCTEQPAMAWRTCSCGDLPAAPTLIGWLLCWEEGLQVTVYPLAAMDQFILLSCQPFGLLAPQRVKGAHFGIGRVSTVCFPNALPCPYRVLMC